MRINRKYVYLGTVALWLFAVGCRNETSDMLKGKWQLKTVEQAGAVSTVDTVWYNFQSESLFMYQIYFAGKDSFVHQYGFKTQPETRTLQLELISNPRSLKTFLPATDWEDGIRTFNVKKITGNRLVLSGDGKEYVFIRF
ncbi:MAG: lipocalin-like domain-containing protein [Tannerella sp.]|nr:lipocalin-like domain-containing protein [Tannerella sp.]